MFFLNGNISLFFGNLEPVTNINCFPRVSAKCELINLFSRFCEIRQGFGRPLSPQDKKCVVVRFSYYYLKAHYLDLLNISKFPR